MTEFCADHMVLREECTEEAVTTMVGALGWEVLDDVTGQDGVARSIVCRAADRVLFEYLVDERDRCAIAVVRGTPEKAVRAVAGMVEEVLLPFSRKELIEAADTAREPEARAAALVRLGLGAPRRFRHRGIYRRIKAVLLDVDAPRDVRLAGVRAAGHTRWPAFAKHLERLADGEATTAVGLHAQVVLTGWGRR